MASSSKDIKMPLVFAISIGSVFALVASVVFGIAWYAYQDKVTLREQVLTEPTHPVQYETMIKTHREHLQQTGTETVPGMGAQAQPTVYQRMPIDQAMQEVVAENAQGEN